MRLVDADAFSAFIKNVISEHGYTALGICDTLTVADVLNSVCAELDGTGIDGLKNAPTVDAVEVVRCRDCKSFSHGYCRFHNAKFVNPKAYCFWGERKDGERIG